MYTVSRNILVVFLLSQMYSPEDATEVDGPSPADERRYEYKKLMMKALAEVSNF